MNLKPLVWSGTLVLVILSIFLLTEINQLSNTAATTNTVSFSGEGRVTAKPDIAVISASIITQATDSKTAQDNNSTKSAAVSAFLSKQGINEKDIKTSGYNISPQQKYPPYGGQPTITGYQVSQSYEIKVRDLTKISPVLSGLVSAGANQVSNLGLKIDNPEALQAQARQLAVDAAKKKASELEKQVGVSLGKIVNFTEGSNGYPVMYDTKMMNMGIGGGPSEAVIPAGENEVTSNVTITYQIK
ncbi:MAG: SIMPL domain-containing protein [Candidatus Pacebacteria bacterium]|nr:SIMPL domain-containing protein [Candidatus Paceibacterota bacterium]